MQSFGEADHFNDILSGFAWPWRRSAQLDERHSKQHSRFWTFGAKIEKMRRQRPGSEEHRNSTMFAKSRKWTWQRIRGNDSTNNKTTVHPFSITALRVAGVVESIPAVLGAQTRKTEHQLPVHGNTERQTTNRTHTYGQLRLAN